MIKYIIKPGMVKYTSKMEKCQDNGEHIIVKKKRKEWQDEYNDNNFKFIVYRILLKIREFP